MRMYTRLLAAACLLAAIAIAPSQVAAQVVDTITVDVYGEPTAITVSGPLRGYVGDTLTYTFEIVDADGNPSMGVTSWQVADPTRATIVAETDSTVSINLLRPGRLTLQVTVARLTAIRLGGQWLPGQGDRAGTFRWADQIDNHFQVTHDPDNPRPAIQLCAVGYSGEWPVFTSHAFCADNLPPDFGVLSALRFAIYGPVKLVPLSAFKNVYPTGIPSHVSTG